MANNKKIGQEFRSGLVTIALSLAALVLFFLSYTTGYYIFGQMQSSIIAALLGAGIAVAVLAILFRKKNPDALWPKLLSFCVTALLAAAAILLLGDRVEGIGNCIVTDYDSGHGGEEAIYMSLGACALLLIAVVYNIIGSFDREDGKGGAVRTVLSYGLGAALLLAVLLPSLSMGGVLRAAGGAGTPGAGGGTAATYTVTFNANNENLDNVPDYQFLCSDFSGFLVYDSRFNITVNLSLDGAGSYDLFSEAFCVEGGKRAEVGDDTGLGQNLNIKAQGSYVDNGDGTVTISTPTHAVFTMEMDTYSSQMKQAAGMNVNGNDEDGVYDSNDEPAVLDFVPETVFVLSGNEIVTYHEPALSGTFTISLNGNDGNLDGVADYQFLGADFSGILSYDNRFYVDISLTLDGTDAYSLFAEAYCVEGGKRAEIGDDTGLGQNLNTVAEGSYVDNGDGTVTISTPTHAVFTMEMDTYSVQMKGAVGMAVGEHDEDGVYDSAAYPEVLDFVPETVFTLDKSGKAIVSWLDPNAESEEEVVEDPVEEAPAAEELVTVASEDGATSFTFYADGSYKFAFADYGVEDLGTYTYDGETLTLTDANGAETVATGDPLDFVYVYSQSDALTGTFSVPAVSLATQAPAAANELLTVPSEDGATSITFYDDGTYKFVFADYGVEDAGTYSYDGETLILTNANGDEAVATGNPLQLHYVTAVSDALTGDYTISASDLA